jgi:cytochrome c biogenesis protein CcdA/thiol-disulfide isomerase/thioredoxin
MTFLVAFAFLAGIVTVLSPCILPVLPVVLAGGAAGGKRRPLGVAAGFIGSFSVLTLALSAIVKATGLDPEVLRWISAGLILAFGLVLAVPFLKDRFALAASRLLARAPSAGQRRGGAPAAPGSAEAARTDGFGAGLVLGLGLGAVWTPCAGPIMASVVTLALTGSVDAGAALITLAYSVGTAIPLLLIMFGGRSLLNKAPWLARRSSAIQRVFGILMMATALALFTGADRSFSTWMLKVFPNYGSGLTAIEDRPEVRSALERRGAAASSPGAAASTAAAAVPARTPDPLGLGEGAWIESPPLSLSGLKGKVVLIDFWTYSCINCVRTLPYLRSWYEAYKDRGFVIVGVHSPEFAFERSEANVRKAIADLGVTWPVVQDNAYGIWNAFSNRYWPAHYLFDRDGKLIETHFGEGGYAETEASIARALGISGAAAAAGPAKGAIAATAGALTPETYLGYGRGQRFSSPEEVASDASRRYSLPSSLGIDHWAFEGEWTIGKESSSSSAGGAIALRYKGERVYLVAGPGSAGGGSAVSARVSLDGQFLGYVEMDRDRMYEILDRPGSTGGLVRIEFDAPVLVYAFTFG